MRRLFAILRSAVVVPLFVSIWTWFLPRWYGGPQPFADARPGGAVVVAIGVAVLLACAWEFAWRGLGTPAPFDPPRKLVTSGLYRFVRNPMYFGLLITLAGEALVFPRIARLLLIEAVGFWIAVSLFVIVFEEPVMRSMFGAEYEEYRQGVGRWIPRVRPWYPRPHLE